MSIFKGRLIKMYIYGEAKLWIWPYTFLHNGEKNNNIIIIIIIIIVSKSSYPVNDRTEVEGDSSSNIDINIKTINHTKTNQYKDYKTL